MRKTCKMSSTPQGGGSVLRYKVRFIGKRCKSQTCYNVTYMCPELKPGIPVLNVGFITNEPHDLGKIAYMQKVKYIVNITVYSSNQ